MAELTRRKRVRGGYKASATKIMTRVNPVEHESQGKVRISEGTGH